MMEIETEKTIQEIVENDRIEWENKHGKRKFSLDFLKKNGYMKNGKEPEWNKLE